MDYFLERKIMNEFTPDGPWIATFGHDKTRQVRDKGAVICFLRKPTRFHGQDERYEKELSVYKARHHLIAAAPAMYEILGRIHGLRLDGELARDIMRECWDDIKQAIALASPSSTDIKTGLETAREGNSDV